MRVVWSVDGQVAAVTSPGRVALLDLKQPHRPPVVLTGSAAAIWAAVDGSSDEERVVEVVASKFGVDPGEIRDEVHMFLGDLAEKQLVIRT